MRIYLTISPNDVPVPIDYQQKLVGTIHKWIGRNNELHDALSFYSFSWLRGSIANGKELQFANGATMFVSFYDDGVLRRVVSAILAEPYMFCGMEVTDVTLADTPDFASRDLFYCGSPIFIKRRLASGEEKQFNYADACANGYLKETLVHKMRQAGLSEDETLDVKFDLSYPKKKLKFIKYHGIGNKASLCPVKITGMPSTKEFAWSVGLGNSTGIGFGSIY